MVSHRRRQPAQPVPDLDHCCKSEEGEQEHSYGHQLDCNDYGEHNTASDATGNENRFEFLFIQTAQLGIELLLHLLPIHFALLSCPRACCLLPRTARLP